MSTVIAKNVQVGTSGTATDNFTIFQPATPDGTLRIGNGNTGITTSQVALTSAGNVGIGTSSPGNPLTVQTAATGTTAGSNVIARFQSNASGRDATIQFSDNVANSATISMLSGAVSVATNGVQRMQLDTSGNMQFNSGYGSVATAYGCRAWVNFNGTGTVAIRGSGNVTSITDNGTGNYTVNFTNAMPDTNYAPVYYNEGGFDVMRYQSSGTQNTNNCQIRTGYISGASLTQADIGTICAAFFR